MKRVFMITLLLISVMILVGCSEMKKQSDQIEALIFVPLENPEVELFEDLYQGENYKILKRSFIDPEWAYLMYAFSFQDGNRSCMTGHYQEVNYIIFYNDEYYSFQTACRMKLFTCDLLVELEIIDE